MSGPQKASEAPVVEGVLDPTTGAIKLKNVNLARPVDRPLVTFEQIFLRPESLPVRDPDDEVYVRPVSMWGVMQLGKLFGSIDKLKVAIDMTPGELMESLAILINQDMPLGQKRVTAEEVALRLDANHLDKMRAIVDAMIHPLVASAQKRLQETGAGASAGQGQPSGQ